MWRQWSLLCVIITAGVLSVGKGQIVTISYTDTAVNEGDTFQFNCTNSDNNSVPTLSINDGDTTSELFNRINTDSIGITTLVASLPNVNRSETNTRFVCELSGSSAEVTITVNYPPLYQQLTVMEYGYFVGSEFSLMLSLLEDGVPASTFAWEKDNEPLGESEGITLTSNSITIASVSNAVDNGTYIVTANNSAGEDSVSFDLLVYFGPYLQAGNNDSETIIITVGESFILDCTVTRSYPSLVTLYAVVNDGVHMNVMDDPILTYTNLFTNNSGYYQCIADSGQAITTYTFNLDVRQATDMPNNMTTTLAPTDSPDSEKGLRNTMMLVVLLLLVCITVLFM